MTVALDEKQKHDSVIMGKENASKEWNCIIPMFLTSFNVYFVFGYTYFMCICFTTAICFFWFFLRQGLAFFGEDRLATLRETKVHKKSCVPFTGNPRVANLAFRLRLADFDPVFLQNNCYRGLIPLNSSR